jgi:hypothetical protein
LLGALLAHYSNDPGNHRGAAWVPAEGLVGIVANLFQVTLGALRVTTNAARVPVRTFARMAAPSHP